ncbi:alkaline phosphatase [Flavobacterium magnum]|uniref:Alkaline phosphatase n=1 Tax=Flavobacterium magnum TaxID=2162713 RepID=A0A2S0RF55_9FLAO|nr:LTA synthase family protein [Flavobacterium magnum]AWA30159.1 alkaline phosphatase [Flavobacterium magnum]
MDKTQKWQNFLKELGNQVFFWFFGIVFFTLFRITFIFIFRKQLSAAADGGEIFKALSSGFSFDCTVMGYFLMLPFLLLLIFAPFDKFRPAIISRKITQILFVILSTIICIITIGYFQEYHDQFNNFLFLALYDDQKAVAKTLMADEYHPLLNMATFIIVIGAGIVILAYSERRDFIFRRLRQVRFKYSRPILVVLVIALFVCSLRGSFSSVPAIRKWAGVSKDAFLNKTIVNPFRSFKYALEDFNELNLLDGKNPFLSEAQFRMDFPQAKVTDLLEKTAQGPTVEKPKHIFLIVMESYDSWPLMDKYKPFKFSENLSRIAANGTQFTDFLPAANATFDSFGAIVTDVPHCGVNISQLGTVNEPFETSIFRQFKKLGYETNLFYGGFLSWENIGDFCKYQGVDRIFSGVDAGGKSDSGDWGIEDEKLFNLVLKNTNPAKNSLNVILTSSYHPPYAIDIYGKGFPYHTEADFPASVRKYYDGGMTMKEMGHLWYGDKAIGAFVDSAEKKYGDGLFCFTGDHYGRRFINHNPNLYEKSSVSFIMYGKSIPKSVNRTPGSHVDIMPTLIEMIAPKGFKYYSFGTSLYDKSKNKAFGLDKMVVPDEIYYFPKEAKIERINLRTFGESRLNSSPLTDDYNRYMALTWHYTIKGNDLKATKKKTAKKN